MSKQVKDNFFKSKDLRKKIIKYFQGESEIDTSYFSKEIFSKFWKNNVSSLDVLIDFFDSLGIKIGVTPSKFGNYWTTKIYYDNTILIRNDYCVRKDAIESAIIQVINILNENERAD